MIKIYKKLIKDDSLKVLADFEPNAWVHVVGPTESELEVVSERFTIDIGLLRDAVDFYELPRIEVEDSNTFIYTQFPYNDGNNIVTVPVLFVIGKNFFITVSDKEFPGIKRFTDEKVDFYTTQKTKLFLLLFSQINTTYNAFLLRIIRQIKSSRIKLEKIKNKDVLQLVTIEEILNNFLSILVPTNNVLKSLLTGRFLRLFEEDEDLVEDLFLDSGQLIEQIRSNLKNIVNIRDAYSTIMTNNLNSVIKLLTSLTVILMVPNIITGLYGMNVSLPFAQSPLAFITLTLTIVIFSVLIFVLFLAKRFF